MSNNKQSSVEWSIDQMITLCNDYDDGKIDYTDYCNGVKEVKSQAKEMHKEEIIEAIELARLIDFNGPNNYYMSEDEIIKALKP